MKKNKKLFVLVALFLAVFAVGGTLAYLTDTSESATNTFKFGAVDITLSEPSWNATTAGDIVPGQSVAKDPTVKVETDSKNAFVFVKVTIPRGTAGGNTADLFTVNTPLGSGWTDVTSSITGLQAGEYVYAYGTASAMTSVAKNTTLPAVFSSVTANANLTESEIADLSNRSADIVVNAYAIQAEGLTNGTTPSAVWTDLGL
jgi:predicted ribosomally synthesized peptide with SipW-like signal peptide